MRVEAKKNIINIWEVVYYIKNYQWQSLAQVIKSENIERNEIIL